MYGATGDAHVRSEVSGACCGLRFVLEVLWRIFLNKLLSQTKKKETERKKLTETYEAEYTQCAQSPGSDVRERE